MITEISIKGFKSLALVERLELGRFNILIGPNASGKSNFLDALRLLQGIGYGLTIDEMFNGKPKTATGESWVGIRGGSSQALFRARSAMSDGFECLDELSAESVRIEIRLAMKRLGDADMTADYMVEINPESAKLIAERLTIDGALIYDTDVQQFEASPTIRAKCPKGKGGGSGAAPFADFSRHLPILGQTRETPALVGRKDALERVRATLGDLQCLDPSPGELRNYSRATNVERMGDHGENFAALIETICAESSSREALVSWLRELRPDEIDDVAILKGAVGDRLFAIRESGRDVPATVLSDGTLRFAAIVAAFLQPRPVAMLAIEEVENGIHASRLRLLVELFRSQTERTGVQLFASTHAPVLLAWLSSEEHRNVLWFRRGPAGETKLTSIIQDPNVAEILRKQPISDLFAEGWLENVL